MVNNPKMSTWTAPDGTTYEICDEVARKNAGGGAEVTAESITAALGYTPLGGAGGTAGQFAVSDGEGGLVWLSQVDVALIVTEIQEETRLDYAVLDVMKLGE